MVIKKKILKQKGGIPNVLIHYFDSIFVLLEKYNKLLQSYKEFRNTSQNKNDITQLLEYLQLNHNYDINLFSELSVILLRILKPNSRNNEQKIIIGSNLHRQIQM